MLAVLVAVYSVIGFFFITLLLSLSKRWQRNDLAAVPYGAAPPEEGVPYGPRPALEP
jgi:hypothetical protein